MFCRKSPHGVLLSPLASMRLSVVACAVGLTVLLSSAFGVSAEAAWLGWGGPSADFKAPGAAIATSWPKAGPAELWSRELGPGYSSILASEGRLYTVYRKGADDVATALDAATGKTLWERANPAPVREGQTTDYGSGPHAAPLLMGSNMITVSASCIVHAMDAASGEPRWTHDLVKEYGMAVPHFGYAAAPIAHGDMAIVLTGGKHGAVGFNAETGKQVWKSAELDISYSTPLVIDVSGDAQLVFMTPNEVTGVGLDDGAIRWRHPHKNQWDTNCIGPWWGSDGLLFVSSMGEAGSRTLRLTRNGKKTQIKELSSNIRFKVAHSTALRFGDHIYASNRSDLSAYHVETGKIAWREAGYTKANLVGVGDKVIALDEKGKLSLLSLTPNKATLHASHQLLSKPAWTAPTVVGTRLYVRDQSKLLALDLAERKATSRPSD